MGKKIVDKKRRSRKKNLHLKLGCCNLMLLQFDMIVSILGIVSISTVVINDDDDLD